MIKHYKEKFWNLSNDELKDIIAGRFREYSSDEVTAAMELIRERSGNTKTNQNTDLPLAQIPSAPMATLLDIVKNPHLWSQDAVEIAEAEILRREQGGSSQNNSNTNLFLKGVLGVVGVLVSVLLVKLIAAVLLFCFLFYTVISCLNDMSN